MLWRECYKCGVHKMCNIFWTVELIMYQLHGDVTNNLVLAFIIDSGYHRPIWKVMILFVYYVLATYFNHLFCRDHRKNSYCFLYSINWLVFIVGTESDYCKVWTKYFTSRGIVLVIKQLRAKQYSANFIINL